MTVLWILLGLFAVWLAVILARACAFKPLPEKDAEQASFDVDEAGAIKRFADMIRFRTVSYFDKEKEDPAQFVAFREYLLQAYPTVAKTCVVEQVGERGVLYHWKGQSAEEPSVLMAHYDVVPVNEAEWETPPFDAVIKEGVLWGRGTLDTKGTLLGIMEAAELMMKKGFVPANDIYMAFGGNEEIFGSDAASIVKALQARGVTPAFVLDEGGAIVEHVFPGVEKPAAVVGIAEKGAVSVELLAKGKGGHASAPPSKQAVGQLGRALYRLQTHPMPFALTKPALEMFDVMGRNSSFGYKVLFANLWCFAPLLDLICKKSGGELNALVRTTAALTMLQGSEAFNILPAAAKAGVNLRLICGDTVEDALARTRKIIGDENVTVTYVNGENASAVSTTQDAAWNRLEEATRAAYPGVLVSPYLMLAGSDSRHYSRVCGHVFRFSGMPLSKEERGLIHNANERIPLDKVKPTISFFASVIARS